MSVLKEVSRGCSGDLFKNLATFLVSLISPRFTFLKRVFNSSPIIITCLIDGFAKVVPINDKLLIEKISRKETEWLIFLLIISNIPLNLQLCVQKKRQDFTPDGIYEFRTYALTGSTKYKVWVSGILT
ncbi:hypothetical protein [Aphanizomenon sp. CS-733/32]|uniref:hypothetical protein n=1 Tax=Aphanizomenon sp. CS-733/32 TaxID=3021715 RepID=UPI00232F60F5|nr:hypothetical protein [Aphanizomenon sp. CS-733/32]